MYKKRTDRGVQENLRKMFKETPYDKARAVCGIAWVGNHPLTLQYDDLPFSILSIVFLKLFIKYCQKNLPSESILGKTLMNEVYKKK